MLNREKEGLLTDMYEGLEYQVLEDLCNEWEFDNDVSVGKFVEQRIDRPFPSEEEACKMLDMRVFALGWTRIASWANTRSLSGHPATRRTPRRF